MEIAHIYVLKIAHQFSLCTIIESDTAGTITVIGMYVCALLVLTLSSLDMPQRWCV